MNRKGFTIIELLVVIVILSVIALIASPIITGVIKDSRKSAFESEVNFIKKAIEQENENTDFAVNMFYSVGGYTGCSNSSDGKMYGVDRNKYPIDPAKSTGKIHRTTSPGAHTSTWGGHTHPSDEAYNYTIEMSGNGRVLGIAQVNSSGKVIVAVYDSEFCGTLDKNGAITVAELSTFGATTGEGVKGASKCIEQLFATNGYPWASNN